MSNLLGLEEEAVNAPNEQESSELELRIRNGANWFYWIAGLSLVNSLIFAFGSPVAFLGGLGLTLVMDALVIGMIDQGAPPAFRVVGIVFNFVLVAIFAFFGYYAGKRSKAAFLAGIILYALDSLIVLVLGDFLMAAFHAFALFFIVRGYLASRSLHAQQVELPQT